MNTLTLDCYSWVQIYYSSSSLRRVDVPANNKINNQWWGSVQICSSFFPIAFYDTLTREGNPDSLVLSSDDKSNRIIEEFAGNLISGGRQNKKMDRITDRLAIRGRRIYLMSKTGQFLRTKESGIWDRKKRPTYYFKVE